MRDGFENYGIADRSNYHLAFITKEDIHAEFFFFHRKITYKNNDL